MTNEEHNRFIAWAFIAHGVFQMFMAFVMVALIYTLFPGDDPYGPPPAFFYIWFGFIFVLQTLFAAPSFIASYALFRRKPWARIAAIVGAALSAMNVPIGTATAVYSLWFFCGENWKEVYPERSANERVDPLRITPMLESQWEGYTKEEEGAYVYRTPPPPDWR